MKQAPINGRRIAEYLERPVVDRASLRAAIKHVSDHLPDTVIFGGMIREFALGQARRFVSDIDLVSMARDAEIQTAIQAFNPRRNKFGGFRFIAGKWRFDIWSLPETWALKQGIVAGENFDTLLATTFFNVDAGLFHLGTRTVRLSDKFELGIAHRVLDVNLQQNPSPHSMARRAMSMALEHNFALSNKLVKYIVGQLPCRPSWVSEVLWDRLLAHAVAGDEPFQIDPQRELPIGG